MQNRLLPFDPNREYKLNNPRWFMWALLVLIIFPAIATFVGDFSLILLPICYTLLVIIGMYTVARSQQVFLTGLLLGFLLLVLVWIDYSSIEKGWLGLVSSLGLLIFFAFILIHLGKNVIQKEKIDVYVLYGVIDGYLILGMIGAELFSILEAILPGSFLKGEELLKGYEFIYYGFVTLTTLGFGDIGPTNGPAEAMSILIALAGQLYLTLVVAIMVGKYLSRKK